MNNRIFEEKSQLGIQRFSNPDAAACRDGAPDQRTEELLGLAASMVLRCNDYNDCIDYPLTQCVQRGFADEELDDAMSVALVVGSSIVTPHLRHAVETVDMLRAHEKGAKPNG